MGDQSHHGDPNGFAVPSAPAGKIRSGSQSSLQASGSHGSLSDLSQTDSNPDLNGSARKWSTNSSPDHSLRRGSASSDRYFAIEVVVSTEHNLNLIDEFMNTVGCI